jgi:hypothetical protein
MMRRITRRRLLGAATIAATAPVLARLPLPEPAESVSARLAFPPTGQTALSRFPDTVADDDGRWWIGIGPILFECAPYDVVDRSVFPAFDNNALGRLIARIVNEVQWIYQDELRNAVMALGCELAIERGWMSATEGGNPYASMNDVERALQEPMPPAIVLNRLHHAMNLVPPWYITRAANPDYDWAAFDERRGGTG